MPQVIIHHEGAYNLYTTIGDGAVFVSAITLKQLTEYISITYGKQGLERLPERLKRAKENGTSSLINSSLSEELCCNRAGENEAHLSNAKFIGKFLTFKQHDHED